MVTSNNLPALPLPLVSREWKNASNGSYNCTPFLHSLLPKGKYHDPEVSTPWLQPLLSPYYGHNKPLKRPPSSPKNLETLHPPPFKALPGALKGPQSPSSPGFRVEGLGLRIRV